MAILAAVFAIIFSGAGCALYGVRIRHDQSLKAYRSRDPFRREQEEEGAMWIAGGVGLVVIALILWWFTRG